MDQNKKFLDMLTSIRCCITYTPLPDEPDPFACPLIAQHPFTKIERLPSSRHLDPLEAAERYKKIVRDGSVCILIPGQKFDKTGTRIGRGGGWFDKFLANVPRNWVRIGICFEHQISSSLLVNKPWDQSVDWTLIITRGTSEGYLSRRTISDRPG